MPHSRENGKFSLVVLVWDEIEALRNIWDSIPFGSAAEVIFMDPGSTDGTIEFIRGKGFEAVLQKRPGRGNAFIEALELVRFENVVFFSGDGNEDPNDIRTIVRHLDEGYDLVIAGRHLLPGAKSDDSDDPTRLRKLVPIMFSIFVDALWKTGVKDAVNGLRGMRRSAMRRMRLDAPKHEIELQSTIRAGKLGLKIKEFPTVEGVRAGGTRKPTAGSLRLGFRQTYYLLREVWIGNRFSR